MSEYHELLILKFLQGTISPEERETLDAWKEHSPENQKTFEELQQVWQLGAPSGAAAPDFQSDEEWNRLESSLKKVKDTPVRKLELSRFYWLKVAASISLLMIFSFVIYKVLQPVAIVREAANNTEQITLPDGSEVWLNAKSRITYHEDFNSDRSLKLEGEAFFDVKKNPDKPFIIHTVNSHVRVMGTSFNVRSFEENNESEVTVITGIVRLYNSEASNFVELKPGETGLHNADNIVLRSETENINALAWKEKRLIFKGTELKDVVVTMQDYFDIQIEVKNTDVLTCRFTSSFNKPTLEEVVEALSVSLNLNIVRQNNIYVVDGEGCKE